MTVPRQGLIGSTLAAAIMLGWAALHIFAVFFLPLDGRAILAAPLLIATLTWLSVGLFIVAHDAMHGSLVPGRSGINTAFGRVALRLYAGFSYDALLPKHFAHHRRPGTDEDPDFNPDAPSHFWPWYARFMREYFGLREFAVLSLLVAVYLLIGAPYPNLLLFWALPSILSSLQLFYFGTYRPHRAEEAGFADDHRARSSGFGWLASLFSCFHFGHHHEHHLAPHVPWWRLPAEAKARGRAR